MASPGQGSAGPAIPPASVACRERGSGHADPAAEEGAPVADDGPNAALAAYLAEIRGREAPGAVSGRQLAIQRCCSAVKKSRSPLNPDHIKLLRGFGEGMLTKRIVGHFAKREFRRLLPPEMPLDAPSKSSGSRSRKRGAASADDDLRPKVRELVDSTLESGQLGAEGRKLNAALRKGLRQTKEGLMVFLCLRDLKDLAILRSCSTELLAYFKAVLKPARRCGAAKARACRSSGESGAPSGSASTSHKRKNAARAGPGGTTPRPKRSRRTIGGAADANLSPALLLGGGLPPPPASAREPTSVTPELKSRLRPCKPFSGGWAIMMGLHLAGQPLRKMELVELSAARGLCREPLVKLQRTVGRGGQWYDAWSSCSRLQRIGWVVRVGWKYTLTAAGQTEAAHYAEECERLRGQSCAAGSLGGCEAKAIAHADPAAEADQLVEAEAEGAPLLASQAEGASLLASQAEPPTDSHLELSASQLEFSASQPAPSASQAQPPTSQGACRHRLRQKGLPEKLEQARGEAKAAAELGVWSVLVDTAEKPIIREALGKLLNESVEHRLPGIDYAFGCRTEDGDWILADVLLERKTTADFHSTLTSRRAELQARVHASLRSAGFRVAMVLEGVQDMKQNPLLGELLKEAYASHLDVLTTANLRDTSELLTGLVSAAKEHEGWTLSTLKVFLQPLYEPDPVDIGKNALRAVGVEKPVAEALTKSYGSFCGVLAQLPRKGEDLEAAMARTADCAGLTLYQTGKAFRLLGLEDAPLSRKRSLRHVGVGLPLPKEPARLGKRWRRGLLTRDADLVVEVGPGLSTVFLGSLRIRLKVHESGNLSTGMLRVCHGTRSYLFSVGNSTSNLEPGRHWLILPKESDWRATTFFAARAYACRAIVSSLCASPEQAARHIAACAASLGKMDAAVPETRATWGKREAGLAGVLQLVRTDCGSMGSFLPAEVATTLARRLRLMADCTSLAQLLQKLQEEGEEFLNKLGVPDFGAKRATAIRVFLLGE